MLLDHCYCPYICTILKYVHHFANIAKLKSCNSISSKVTSYLPRYYNTKTDQRTLKLVHRYLVLPSSVTIRITLLHYYTHTSHNRIMKYYLFSSIFLEAEMKS